MIPATRQLSAESRATLYNISIAHPKTHVLSGLFVNVKVNNNRSDDLENTRHQLLEIRWKEVRYANEADAQRYNAAVASFNRFYPEHPLDAVPPGQLRVLFNECLRPVQTELPPIAETATVDIETYNFSIQMSDKSELIEEICDDFMERGGKIVFLPLQANTERLEGAIAVTNEEIIPVCYAGWFRSAASFQFAAQMQQRLGFCFGTKTRPTHGILKGYDPSTWSQNDLFWRNEAGEKPGAEFYFRAFGMERPFRSGFNLFKDYLEGKIDGKELTEKFQSYYYHHSSSEPKIFWAFRDTGYILMQHLLKKHPATEDNLQPLRGVTVAMIPDNDWISHFTIKGEMKAALIEATEKVAAKVKGSIKPLSELSNAERREVYFAFRGWKPITEQIKALMESYVDYIEELKALPIDPLQAMMLIEGFRAGYWKWSGAFIPVKKHPS